MLPTLQFLQYLSHPNTSQNVYLHFAATNSEAGSYFAYFQGIIPGLAWRDWGKPRSPSVTIGSIRAEMWTHDLPNTKKC
jgi:hypothetical protein